MAHFLINKKAVRTFILEYAERTKVFHGIAGSKKIPRFVRVADSIFDEVQAAVRDKCRSIVARQPASGKTVK